MRIGRCVKEEPALVSIIQDPRYLGCATDVLHILSRQCSGKSQCTMRVNDQNLIDDVKPCFDSLKMYLEATYICIDGRRPIAQGFIQPPRRGGGELYPETNLLPLEKDHQLPLTGEYLF